MILARRLSCIQLRPYKQRISCEPYGLNEKSPQSLCKEPSTFVAVEQPRIIRCVALKGVLGSVEDCHESTYSTTRCDLLACARGPNVISTLCSLKSDESHSLSHQVESQSSSLQAAWSAISAASFCILVLVLAVFGLSCCQL